MAVAKKGTRLIDVGGVRYRWVVSPDSGYMVVVVELAEAPRQRLLAYTDYCDELIPGPSPDSRLKRQRTRIAPGSVRRWIEQALAVEWKPAAPGPDLRLRPPHGVA